MQQQQFSVWSRLRGVVWNDLTGEKGENVWSGKVWLWNSVWKRVGGQEKLVKQQFVSVDMKTSQSR